MICPIENLNLINPMKKLIEKFDGLSDQKRVLLSSSLAVLILLGFGWKWAFWHWRFMERTAVIIETYDNADYSKTDNNTDN